MTDGDLQIEARKRRHKRRRSIAVDKHDIRLFALKHRLDFFEYSGSDIEKRLSALHDRKIVIRRYGERAKHRVEHFPVLSRHAHNRIYVFPRFELVHERTHFYRFRTGSENKHYFFHRYLRFTFLL